MALPFWRHTAISTVVHEEPLAPKSLYFLTRLILYLQVDPALAVDDEVVYFRYSRTDSHDGLSINLFCVGMKCLIFL